MALEQSRGPMEYERMSLRYTYMECMYYIIFFTLKGGA